MKTFASLALATVLLLPASAIAQGSLTPLGAPAPTMKTLDQLDAKLEPRTPIIALPAVIDASGSYYLTGNLVEILDQDGITISADDVTIDLNGFQLVSLVSFSHNGITVTGLRRNLCIRNGTISGWGQNGILADNAWGSQFENLRISNNGGYGLRASKCTIKNCTATSNTSGMSVYDAVVRDCTAEINSEAGISATQSSLTACVAANNGGHGIVASESSVTNCTTDYNGTDGIRCSGGSVTACAASHNWSNGIHLYGSLADKCHTVFNQVGIYAESESAVSGCSVARSLGNGITAAGNCHILSNSCIACGFDSLASGIAGIGGGNRIEGNTVTDTQNSGNGVAVAGGGNLIIHNSARGNGTNFSGITATDSAGPIVTSATIGTNNNPNANFAF